MKSKILYILSVIFICNLKLFAQGWNSATPPYTYTTDFVGIGVTSPASALQIDGNNMTGPATTGEVFRTDGPSGSDQRWRLYSGGTEIFKIENATGSSGIRLMGVASGSMKLYSQGTQRIHIDPGSTSSTGYVSIGNGFSSPASRLHIKEGNSGDIWFQMTGDNTGDNNTDGFRIGVINNATVSNQAATLRQNETAPMNFLTSASPRFQIFDAASTPFNVGFVAIGDYTAFAPQTLMHQHITSNSNTYHTFTTNRSSATATTDGFKIGITDRNSLPEVDINQQENAPMRFYTNATERMIIKSTGEVGIGVSPPAAWLHVTSSGSSNAYAALTENANSGSTGAMGGIKGTCNVSRSGVNDQNIGGWFEASQASDFANNGVIGKATGINNATSNEYTTGGYFEGIYGDQVRGGICEAKNGNVINYAMIANAYNNSTYTPTNYGVWAQATSQSTGGINFGVYGTATNGDENYGVYGEALVGTCGNGPASGCTDAAGFFEGDVFCTTNSYYVSDANIKTNIQPITNGLSVISQLAPQSYTFDPAAAPGLVLPLGTQYGLLAQDLSQVLPSLVKEARSAPTLDANGNIIEDGFKFQSVNYISLIPFLISSIQEQQQQIDDLNQALSSCCAQKPTGMNINETEIQRIQLGNESFGILYQNEPNPFSSQTKIRYFIPESAGKAVMTFYDNTGKPMKEVTVSAIGEGTVEVDGSNLSSDIYTYSLVIDGKLIDTKRMVKTK